MYNNTTASPSLAFRTSLAFRIGGPHQSPRQLESAWTYDEYYVGLSQITLIRLFSRIQLLCKKTKDSY